MKRFLFVLFLLVVFSTAAYVAYGNLSDGNDPTLSTDVPKEINYRISRIERVNSLPGDLRPGSGNEFMVVTVTGQNNDTINRLYNVFYFSFEDEDGVFIENGINTRSDAMVHGELIPGASVTASVVFEIERGMKGILQISDEDLHVLQTIEIN